MCIKLVKNLKFTISAPLNIFVLISDGHTNDTLILFLGFKTDNSTLKPIYNYIMSKKNMMKKI